MAWGCWAKILMKERQQNAIKKIFLCMVLIDRRKFITNIVE